MASVGTDRPYQAQALWARSQRVRPWPDRYLLLELAMMADGSPSAPASAELLSGLSHVPVGAVKAALSRMEGKGVVRRETDAEGRERIALGYPSTITPKRDVCANVRGEGGV